MPGLYALLPDKTQTTYNNLFSVIHKLADDRNLRFNPRRMTVDFEMAMINSIEVMLPETEISTCLFHFTQSIFRNLTNHGLRDAYLNDEAFKSCVRKMMALSLLPITEIVNQFHQIVSQLRDVFDDERVDVFVDYMWNTYVKDDSMYDKELWCQHGNSDRTTNVAEGWNNSINYQLTSNHPNVHVLINLLQKDNFNQQILYSNYLERDEAKPKRAKYVRLNERLSKLNTKLVEGEMTVERFLEIASNLLKDFN